MKGLVYKLVQRLSEPDSGLSRNRQHTLFESPEGNRALHLLRHLRSLANDVDRYGPEALLDVHRAEAHWQIRLEVPRLRLRRLATLTVDDLAVLAEERTSFPPALRNALRAAGAWP